MKNRIPTWLVYFTLFIWVIICLGQLLFRLESWEMSPLFENVVFGSYLLFLGVIFLWNRESKFIYKSFNTVLIGTLLLYLISVMRLLHINYLIRIVFSAMIISWTISSFQKKLNLTKFSERIFSALFIGNVTVLSYSLTYVFLMTYFPLNPFYSNNRNGFIDNFYNALGAIAFYTLMVFILSFIVGRPISKSRSDILDSDIFDDK